HPHHATGADQRGVRSDAPRQEHPHRYSLLSMITPPVIVGGVQEFFDEFGDYQQQQELRRLA
ncbi:hypothetical protein, partial [Aeromonas cavernicola]|uniref:hypothetical protein n=1 Tax=Aeromonas cavernicola TaxID=1006623 RepID=UPI001F333676